jgi:glycosyltransferase involved in cell wall biosynthesis
MKILQVTASTAAESGGPIESVLRNSEVWVRDGHSVEVVSLEDETADGLRRSPLPLVQLGRGVGKYRYNPRLAPWMRAHASRFDVVILNGLWNYTSVGSWLGLRKTATPYYIFAHGMMAPWFRKFWLKQRAKELYWWLAEGRVVRDARAVLFTTEQEMLDARNVFTGHVYRERLAPFGASDPEDDGGDDAETLFAAFPQLRDRKYLLFLGRLHPIKGCDLLLEALSQFVDNIPDELHLVFAGPDHLGWSSSLRVLARQLGLDHRVHWIGMIEGKVKQGMLRKAEALILPSHHENFGLVVAEAMACSTPVLISNKVNIWREVKACGGGLVDEDTREGTMRLIARFYALSPEERAAMGQSARRGFLQYFEATRGARNLLRSIESDLGTLFMQEAHMGESFSSE